MNLEFDRRGEVTVVRVLETVFDAACAPEFKQRVGACIERGERRIALDFERVTFLDSGGLGALLSLVRLLEGGGYLALCGCTAPVAEILRLTRLDRVFDFYRTSEEAVAALG